MLIKIKAKKKGERGKVMNRCVQKRKYKWLALTSDQVNTQKTIPHHWINTNFSANIPALDKDEEQRELELLGECKLVKLVWKTLRHSCRTCTSPRTQQFC